MKSIYTVGPVSVAAGQSIDLKPGTSDYLYINTISYGGAVELYVCYVGNELLVDSDSTAGTRTSLVYYATYEHYYKVKNVSAVSFLVSADGLVL
jgi:hypothetical protein